MTISLGDATIHELRNSLRGECVTPGDAARARCPERHDRPPAALIARCADAADVVEAVGFARSEGLTVAVCGAAHSVARNAIPTAAW